MWDGSSFPFSFLLPFLCDFFGAHHIFLGQAWVEDADTGP